MREFVKADLVEKEVFLDACREYLKKELYYSDSEAKFASMEMADPDGVPYIIDKYEGTCEIDGIKYDIYKRYTDYGACYGTAHLADAKSFEAYVLEGVDGSKMYVV